MCVCVCLVRVGDFLGLDFPGAGHKESGSSESLSQSPEWVLVADSRGLRKPSVTASHGKEKGQRGWESWGPGWC